MYFEKNLQALIQADPRHDVLRDQLLKAPELADDEYEFFETEDGHFTLKYRDVFLHDPKQPIEEVRQAFATQCTASFDQIHLVLGLGLGYAVEHVLKASTGKIIIYEPHLSLLRFLFENVDLSHHFTSGRVWLAATPLELSGMMSKRIYGDHQLDVLALRAYAYLLKDEIPEIMNQVLTLTDNWIQDVRTGNHFHFKWIEQFFNNYPHFDKLSDLTSLVGRFAGKPAIVISRGPSLDEALPAIAKMAGAAVLIAVGGALRRLWESGITPDFAVFYDANGMAEQLHGLSGEYLEKITFLVSPFTQACCYETPSYGKILFLGENNGQFARFLDEALNKKHPRIEGGGTVSLIAYEAAQLMACSPIILTGQDLAFPKNQVYAGGVDLKIDENGRMALEKTDDLYTEPETMATVAGQNGDILPTLKCYLSYIRHFEELAVKNQQQAQPAQLYNCSLGGALIEGFALTSLHTLVNTYPAWKEMKNGQPAPALPQPPGFPEAEVKQRGQELLERLRTLKEEMRYAIKLCVAFNAAENAAQIRQDILTDFYYYTQKHAFLEYMMLFEMLQYKRRFKEVGGQYDPFSQAVLAAAQTLLDNSTIIWKERLFPLIERAEQRLANAENPTFSDELVADSVTLNPSPSHA